MSAGSAVPGGERSWTVQDHLDAAPAEQVELYRAVERIIRDCGPVTLSVSKTTITFKGERRGFAGARPVARGGGPGSPSPAAGRARPARHDDNDCARAQPADLGWGPWHAS